MINSLWISKTGMQAQQTQLDVISNNMANVSTNGFKRSNAVFEDLMYQNLRQVGAADTEQNNLPTGLQVGLGVRTVATSRSFAQGSLQQSGNQLDLAVNGSGFLQVDLADGTTGYTRDGSLQVDANGPSGDLQRPDGGGRYHHSRRSPEHHGGQRRRGDGETAGQRHAAASGHAGAGQFREPGRPRATGRQPRTQKVWRPATRSRERRAAPAWGSSCRAMWRPPTSMWCRSWSP